MAPRPTSRTRAPGRRSDQAAPGGGAAASGPQIDHGVDRDELVARIILAYGVDRVRATAGADLYLRQLRRRTAPVGC